MGTFKNAPYNLNQRCANSFVLLYLLGPDILQIVDADVLVARIQDPTKQDKNSTIVGDKTLVPGEAFWSKFRTHPTRELCAVNTRKAIEQMGLSKEACPASGIVYFRDGLVQIMLGRGLRSKDVRWGGNPDEPKLRIGGVLNPRNSFDTFMEKAKKESRAWTTKDLHVATALMDRVCEHSHNRMMTLLKSDIEEANVKYFNAISRARENSSFFAQMSHEIRTPVSGSGLTGELIAAQICTFSHFLFYVSMLHSSMVLWAVSTC